MRMVLTLLVLLLVSGPVSAKEASPHDDLVREARRHALTLYKGIRRTRGTKRYALEAAFVLDTAGHLVLRVLVSPFEGERRTFELWSGRVYDDAWVPRRDEITAPDELAAAQVLWKQVEAMPDALSTALAHLVRDDDNPDRLAELALAATPEVLDGKTVVVLQAHVAAKLHSVTFPLETRVHTLAAPRAPPKRVPVDERALPEFEVPLGRWLNTETTPTFAALRGRPALVLVTSPG